MLKRTNVFDYLLYYNFIDDLDFSLMTPHVDIAQIYTHGKGKTPIGKESLALLAVDKKCDLLFSLQNGNHKEALSAIGWFETIYNIKIADVKYLRDKEFEEDNRKYHVRNISYRRKKMRKVYAINR